MTKLTILAGIPGCGKSTWAKAMLDGDIVSSDEIRKDIFGSLVRAHKPETKAEANKRVFEIFHARIALSLKEGTDVVADATFLTKESRQKAKDIAYLQGAAVYLVFFKNVQQALTRNASRDRDQVVPEDQMTRFVERYHNTLAEIATESYDGVTRIEATN